MMSTITVFFNDGGMGDVGKHVVASVLMRENLRVRAVGLSLDSLKRSESVTQPKIEGDRFEMVELDVASTDAAVKEKLTAAVDGASAVVCCIGSRQGSKYPRNAEAGTRNIIEAMKSKGVSRLVVLSSAGVADGWPPMPWTIMVRFIFSAMLLTTLKKSYLDLCAARDVVQQSDTDFLMVCPTGLTPTEKAAGTWKILDTGKARGNETAGISIAKEDVAEYLLQEAIQPTRHKQAITIGSPLPAPKK